MEFPRKPTILFVDDIRENMLLLEHIIRPLDVNIISAISGQEALEKSKGQELFLALIDVKMPVMDGIELAIRLQSNAVGKIVPVIFITAFADNNVLEKCYQVGAVDFISKPFQRHILLGKVKIFLELYRQKHQIRENKIQLEETAKVLDQMNQSLKKSHEELSHLTAHLEEVREDERKQIALDLHDDLGQRLTVLLMDMAWLKNNISRDKEKILEKYSGMKSLLEDTINTVRKISIGLRPSALDNLGIAAALKWHLSDFKSNTGIRVLAEIIPDEIEIDPKLSILIFRVVQEALTNVARHANATRVDLKLKKDETNVFLMISDNGIGITNDKIGKPQSFGLIGMKERISSWGGKLQITGEPGKGTQLIINLPVNSKKK